MGDPLITSILVAGALAALAVAVTFILWRTVHGRQKNVEHRNPKVKNLLDDLGLETKQNKPAKVRDTDDGPLNAKEVASLFEKAVTKNEEKNAIHAACALTALGQEKGPHIEYLSDHAGPVDSHKWKTLSDTLLRRYVFSPREDPFIDALSALISRAINLNVAPSLADHGLESNHICANPGEGPEFMLTLTRCGQALGMNLPPVYVDETCESGLDILWVNHRLGPRLLIRLGAEAASIPSSGRRSFLCGSVLTLLHPSLLLTLFSGSPANLWRVFKETRLFIDETGSNEMDETHSISGIVEPTALSAVSKPILDLVRLRGGWPSEEDVDKWWDATQETCFRTGLVLSGDIREARLMIGAQNKTVDEAKEPHPSGSPQRNARDCAPPVSGSITRDIMQVQEPGIVIENLVGFLLSDAYDLVRKRLVGQAP